MPELLTIDEVAAVLRLDSTDKVYELMNKRGLPFIKGITKGRLILDEDLWKWVKRRSFAIENDADESCEE